jgi:hypothetical protein
MGGPEQAQHLDLVVYARDGGRGVDGGNLQALHPGQEAEGYEVRRVCNDEIATTEGVVSRIRSQLRPGEPDPRMPQAPQRRTKAGRLSAGLLVGHDADLQSVGHAFSLAGERITTTTEWPTDL